VLVPSRQANSKQTVNSTYIHTAGDQVRASQPALISEAATLIGWPPSRGHCINMRLQARRKHPTKNPKVPGNISAPIPLPHLHQGGGLQSPECPHAVSQLPAIWARLGKLQTAAMLFMVRGWTPAQRVRREGKC
jgi:hypothetical protein